MNIATIILAGGNGNRLGNSKNKIFTKILGKTMLEYSVLPFLACNIKDIVIVCKEDEQNQIKQMLSKVNIDAKVTYAQGGIERQNSCQNGLNALESNITHVLIHDCARMLITPDEINRCIEALSTCDAVITAVPLKDTIKRVQDDDVIETPDRSNYVLVQTPQCFSVPLIKKAHEYAKKSQFLATDDAGLIEHMGDHVKIIEGSYENIKITTKDDIIVAENILRKRGQVMDSKPLFRIGNGVDVHALVRGRKLILGGVNIEHEKGLLGHSDADVLTHAIMDAILGAAALGDIGVHFPDTDNTFKDANSLELLKKVMLLIQEKNYAIGNIDVVVMAQEPKLQPYVQSMRENIAKACNVDLDTVNIKATTTEHLSFIGREEGIAALANATLYTKN